MPGAGLLDAEGQGRRGWAQEGDRLESFLYAGGKGSPAMQIDVAPETERLVREEISSGHFRSVDELIKAGVEAWREKNAGPGEGNAMAPEARNLFDLFAPVRGLLTDEEIDRCFTRNPSAGRSVDRA